MPIKVAIVDDDKDMRPSLATLVRGCADSLQLAGNYANAELALKEIPASSARRGAHGHQHAGHGRDRMRPAKLKAIRLSVQFLMLTVYEDGDSLLFNSCNISAQAHNLTEIIAGVLRCPRGGSPMTPQVARRLVQSFFRRRAVPA